MRFKTVLTRGCVAAVGVLALGAGSAQAANTLTVTGPQAVRVGDTATITTAGSTDMDGRVYTYAEPNGADCARTEGDHFARVNARFIDLRSLDAGPFSVAAQFEPSVATTYRLCAYLYFDADNSDTGAPRLLATSTFAVSPPPPPPDGDADGVPDNVDTCPAAAAPGTFNGCPVPDTDKDGKADNVDVCPAVAAATPNGCPPPDTDGDGKADTIDKCPTVASPAADGCPVRTAPKCKVPKLKGKTLTAAKAALKKGNCKLGKVTKPKRARKGAKLVVSKQSGSSTVAVTLTRRR